LHTFIFAKDIVARGGEAKIVFEAAGPKWLLELPKVEHKLHKMYQTAKEARQIAVCKACAAMAGATKAAQQEGLPLLDQASGHPSLGRYVAEGYHIVTL
jgi:hypothetical protein